MVAGGTGVTPMLQFADQILSNEEDETRVLLLYSVHSSDELIYKLTLDEWKSFWNFNVIYFLTVRIQFFNFLQMIFFFFL